MSLASEYEQTIRDFRLPELTGPLQDEEFILPQYGGYSIANLARTIVSLLGKEQEETLAQAGLEPALPGNAWEHLAGGVRTVIVVVLDAVGYLGFKRLLEREETGFGQLVENGTFVPLTSVFPSTTMAAMSSIWTGRTPADHGFLGRRLFLAEYGFLADMIRLMPAIHGRPGSLDGVGMGARSVHSGAPPGAVAVGCWVPDRGPPVRTACRRRIVTPVSARGGTYRGVYQLQRHVDQRAGDRDTAHQKPLLLVSAYWAGTDDVAHTYGPEDERLEAAVRQIAQSFERDFLAPLPAAAREGTVVIITADHGQVETPPERAVHLKDHPALKEMLLWPPSAEPRASYLHVRRGCAEMARELYSFASG